MCRQVPWRCRGCATLPSLLAGRLEVSRWELKCRVVTLCFGSEAAAVVLFAFPPHRARAVTPAPFLHGYGAPSCLNTNCQKEATSSAVDTVENPKLHAGCTHVCTAVSALGTYAQSYCFTRARMIAVIQFPNVDTVTCKPKIRFLVSSQQLLTYCVPSASPQEV